MARQLTEKQQILLNVLFEEAGGNLRKAMLLAGYSPNTPTADVLDSISDEIAAKTNRFIAQTATQAAYSMYEVMADPVQLGNKEKMNAAKDVLDRAGFVKTEKVEVKASEPLFILPAKSDDEEDD